MSNIIYVNFVKGMRVYRPEDVALYDLEDFTSFSQGENLWPHLKYYISIYLSTHDIAITPEEITRDYQYESPADFIDYILVTHNLK